MDETINLQDLPDIALEKIFSYLTFNQIAENRIVSRKFNEVGKEALNRGYHMVEKFHRYSLKAVRSKLPRRESERKVHPLARQCDILVAIETRLSMLSMTFLKYMECKQCCFIPGKVIDELLRVIKYVNKSLYPPRPHDLLQELRDITSMAMEHFEERIVPILKERMNVYKASTMSSLLGNHLRVACNMPSTSISCDDVCSALRRNQSSSKVNRNLINVLLLEAKRSRKRDNLNKKQLKVTQNIVQQQKREIIKLKRVIQNWEAKFRDLSAEVRTISTHPFKRRGDSLEDDSVCVFVDTFDDGNMTPTRKSKKPRN